MRVEMQNRLCTHCQCSQRQLIAGGVNEANIVRIADAPGGPIVRSLKTAVKPH